jgi:TraX protein
MNPTISFWSQRQPIPAMPALSARAQDALKLTAILSMVSDHVNRSLNPYPLEFPGLLLAWFGRLAFPLFCLLIAHNLTVRRVPWQRYVTPLLIAGLLSQWPFQELIATQMFNIMFTLLLGVLAHAANEVLDQKFFKGAGMFAVMFASFIGLSCDYPLFGYALIPLAVMLMRGQSLLAWIPFLAIAYLTNVLGGMPWVVLLVPVLVFAASRLEGGRFLRLPYFGYWFYPLQLMVILAVRAVLR